MATVMSTSIEAMKAEVLDMMRQAKLSISESVRSLDDRDVDAAKCVINRDRQIDLLEQRIEAKCLELLAGKIEGKALRTVAATYKMISDIERIGDNCVSVANVTLAVANKPVTASTLNIIKMANTALRMMDTCMRAYEGNTSVNVEQVFDEDRDIDRLYNDVFVEAVTSILQEPRTITNTIYLTAASRALERIGDHITDIAERIVFIETGKLIERSEPMHVPEFPQ